LTWAELGDVTGKGENAVRMACRETDEYKRDHDLMTQADLFKVSTPEIVEISGDAAIVHDVHAPTTDLNMARRVIPVSEKLGVKRLILAGDLLNMELFSSYDQIIDSPHFEQELNAVRFLLQYWGQYFEEMYWIRGNHEDRWFKAMKGSATMERLRNMIGGIAHVQVSDRDVIKINTDTGLWIVPHGANYSVQQLNVADVIAQKYQAHVVMGHQHHCAKGWDRFGRYVIVDNGGLFDKDNLHYVQLKTTKSPEMKTGFTVLKGGFAHVFGESPYTNWEEVLK
jgi:hypothetical protein